MTRRSLGRALSIPSNTFRPSQKRRKFTNVEAYLLPGWIKSRKRSFLLPLQSSLSFLFALLGPDWNLALVQAHLVWYSSEAWPTPLGVTACTRPVSLVDGFTRSSKLHTSHKQRRDFHTLVERV